MINFNLFLRRGASLITVAALALAALPMQKAQADNTTQAIPFSQSWTNIGLITANDDWSGVPGVVGFLGQDITTGTGVDPQTLLTVSAAANDVDVIANQTSISITNGGVGEFHLADPVVALQGSGTADAPHLILHLNTVGQSNITIAYNLRDIDGTTDNAIQPVALQYRVGSSGNFTNVPTGFVADATTGPSLATLVTPVNVVLPAAVDNQSEVQIRIITSNAVGNDEWVGVDDISVTGSVEDLPPGVSGTSPANGVTGVAVNTNITVNFNEVVDVAAGAITVECPTSNVVASNALADNVTSVVIDPASDLPFSTACVINVSASGVTDDDADDPPDNMESDFASGFETAALALAANLVINEIDYDQPSTDASEFVEIRNNDSISVDLSAYNLQLINGSGGGAAQYQLFALPVVNLAPGDYFVVCGDAANVPNCDLDVTPNTDLIQNGAPDAAALRFGTTIIDAVSYEGNTGAPYTEGSGVGLLDDPAFTGAGISRCADGVDTNQNNVDFSLRRITPGAANACLPAVVINEIDYDQPGTDAAEFIEIRNNDLFSFDLSSFTLELVNGSGTLVYQTITLSSVSLAPNDYYVVCANAANTANCDQDVTPDTNLVQNGAPDAVGLRYNGTLIDAVSYEGDTGAPYTEGSGTGLTDDGVSATQGISRCPDGADTNQNNVDLSVRTITPGAASDCAVDVPPTVASTSPINGATDVALAANILVNFSEAVTVSGSWYDVSCSVSGAHTAVVSGGPQNYTLNPDVDFIGGETCTVTVTAANVTDQDGAPDNMAADYSWSFTPLDVCAAAYTPIYAIQGSGLAAAITGTVSTQGIVVGDYEGPSPTLRGFYIQDPTGDGDANTSDGLFVFNGDNNNVNLGDLVRVSGSAGEFQDQTQISSVTAIAACGTGAVAPTDVWMPFASATDLERFEGMLVRFPQTLYVTEHFQLGRFGQVVMSSDARLQQPTNVVLPGAPAIALQAANNLNRIIVDDALQNQNPDPIVFGRNGNPLSASNTLRGGDSLSNVVGILSYTWAGNAASGNAYRLRPINAMGGGVPNFVAANPRPASAPAVGGSLKVVGMNLLNFFNTFGVGACTGGVGGAAMDCRGADDAGEFARQWPKTVAAILALDADVIGVNEIENDGYGPTSALQFLVDRLNDATAPGTYAFIDVDTATGQLNALGTDAIKVSLLYKPASVTPVGQTAALNSVAFVNGGDSAPRSRPSLAQAFQQNSTGAVFIVDVNHLKSKGSACDAPDAGDGQGNCNQVRVNAATELMNWLAGDPTGTGDPDILLVGDYNSYAMEDPITVITSTGYINLISSFLGPDAYSYVFDGQWGYLDHALASASLVSQVTGVGDYHINADEPSVLDYNDDFKSPGQIISLYAPDQFRVSDHDPVIVGLNLNVPPTLVVAPGGACASSGGTLNLTLADVNGDTLTLSGASSDTGVVPNANIVFGGSGANRTVTLTAIPAGTVRTATITVTVSDGLATAETTITVIVGTSGHNTSLTGTSGADLILGLSGNDLLSGLAGHDVLCGGSGNNLLNGGDDDDTLVGDSGKDLMNGDNGNDHLLGASGNDGLTGGNGNDILDGGSGNDLLNGGAGDDSLLGESGNDLLTGGADADFFSGGTGNDVATDFNAGAGDTQDGTIP